MTRASSRRVAIAVACVLFIAGMWRAGALAWICDDAFVSLRYAQNLVAGHGLVYNPGERVEGYTNLLWTLALAGALAVGAPDVASAEWLGIGGYAALALLLLGFRWRRHRRQATPFLPLAALAVLVAPDFHDWASGGLETSLFACLAAAGMLLSLRAEAHAGRALAAGLAFSLLALTRPDGVLFAVAASVGVWLRAGRDRRVGARALLLLGVPVLATLAGWAAFKLAYYGELLPTAFYAKSVLRPYWGQGLVYLGLFLAKSWYLPVALAALVAWRWHSRQRIAGGDADSLVLAGAALLHLVYVVHVGGDFMFARRILPAVPLLLLALEEQLVRAVPARARGLAAAACVVAAALPFPVFAVFAPAGDGLRIRGIADERRFYPEEVIAARRRQAEVVGVALAGTDARVTFEGGMCVFGYYSGLPYLVEMTGLTQYSLARLPLAQRGWIGHEKRATDVWLTDHDIHFVLSQRFPPVARPPGADTTDLVYFGDVAVARIHRYDDAVMEALRRRPGVSFVPIQQVIERRRREIERASPERAREILAWLERYYLDAAPQRGGATGAELRALVGSRAPAAPETRRPTQGSHPEP